MSLTKRTNKALPQRRLAVLAMTSLAVLATGCATGGSKHASEDSTGLEQSKPMARVGSEVVPTLAITELEPKALALCRDTDRATENSDEGLLLEVAKACVAQKNWTSAEKVAQLLSRRDLNSGWGAFFLSLSAEGQGNLDRSLWMIELAMKKSVNATLFSYQRARLLWQLDRKSEAVVVMKKVVENDSRLFEGQMFLGNVAKANLDFKEAKSHFQEVISQRPKFLAAHLALADVYQSQNETAKAIEQLNSAITSVPNALDPRMRLARVLEAQEGSQEQALQTYKEIKAFLQSHPEASTGRSSIEVAEKIRQLESQVRKPALIGDKQAAVPVLGGVQ